MRQLLVMGLSAFFAMPAMAQTPRVAVDIAPLHGLVARVMDGVGDADLILPQGVSPHGYVMRPSEAAALQKADLVFWIGETLTPWLHDAIGALAGKAQVIEMMDVPGTVQLPYRDGIAFEVEGDDAHAGHDHGSHDDHDDHGDHEGHDHEGHDHAGVDPHGWLDPHNGALWLGAIAEALAGADPDNAETYRANARAGAEEIAALSQRTQDRLAPLHEARFIVFHDAYQYFEARFDLHSVAAISLGDASKPGAARIAALRTIVADRNIRCVFAEPQFNPRIVQTVAENAEIRQAVIDPQGGDIPLGSGFYPALIEQITDRIAGCLTPS